MHLTSRLKTFFFSPCENMTLGIFRIALGIFLIVYFFALFPNWEIYYGSSGIRSDPIGFYRFSFFFMTPDWVPFYFFWWLGLFSSILFTLGWKTRIATCSLFLIQTSMNFANQVVINGEDLVLRMLLFYAIFTPLGNWFSLDAYFKPQKTKGLIWSVRLMQINIALIYAFSLPEKLLSDRAWTNGEALYWVMMTSTWARPTWRGFFYHETVSHVLTMATVLVEGLFPILVWFKATRLPILFCMSVFHLGLAITLKNVGFFSFSMLCSFILFIPPECTKKWTSSLSDVLSGRLFAKKRGTSILSGGTS